MILAAHQPQYLAWPGYYHKMGSCDAWVYLDDVQFKKREFQNRNRIKSAQGEIWLSVPVLTKGRREQRVRDVELDPTQAWAAEHMRSLELNYRKAPCFAEHEPFFRSLYGKVWTRLAPLCRELDGYLRERWGIRSTLHEESKIGTEGVSTQRLVSLCKRLKADSYLSGQGGKGYLDERTFEAAGIKLIYQDFRCPQYPQRFGPFLPNLAAIDMLFNCLGEECRALLFRG